MPSLVKERSPEQTAISVSLTKDQLAQIDARADSLNLPRSRYLVLLAQHDIARGGPLTIVTQEESQTSTPVDFTPAALDFLKLAVPALTQYQDSHGQCPPPEFPEATAHTELWEFFLKQRDQILKDKWIQSSNAGYDIGMDRAIRHWLQKNQDLWFIPQDDAEATPQDPAPATPPNPA